MKNLSSTASAYRKIDVQSTWLSQFPEEISLLYKSVSKVLTTVLIKPSSSFSGDLVDSEKSHIHFEPREKKVQGIGYSENATTEEFSAVHIVAVPIVIDDTVTITLLQKIAQDDFVAGETSASERYIEDIANEYGWINTMNWLDKIYLDNYSNPAILIGLMHCLSHFKYEDIKPIAPTMALGVLQHSDIFVRDYAVRAFENWNDKEALPILKALSCDAKWLQDYIDEVIKALERV
jgi:hypothetical protein